VEEDFLVEPRTSDVLSAVTGNVPKVVRLTCQIIGIVQPPGDLSSD
jgi:hypothetical protein